MTPSAVLAQQEGQQHQQAAVVNNPPDVDMAVDLHDRRNSQSGDYFQFDDDVQLNCQYGK
jgi:hypothetical protein